MALCSAVESRSLKAKYLLIQNIRALMAARRVEGSTLSLWCGHKPPWLSKILQGERGMSFEDLDCVADFFGLLPSQLLSPGISSLTERRRFERRRGERRGGRDRRGVPRPPIHPDVTPTFPDKVPERKKQR
jgi:hypothetical protein